MKRTIPTEDPITGILKEHDAGVSVADLCRKLGVSDAAVVRGVPWGINHVYRHCHEAALTVCKCKTRPLALRPLF